jgi:hypothetical protein
MRQSDDKGGSHGPDGTVLGRERERRLRIPSGDLLLAPIDRDHVKFLECPLPIPRAGPKLPNLTTNKGENDYVYDPRGSANSGASNFAISSTISSTHSYCSQVFSSSGAAMFFHWKEDIARRNLALIILLILLILWIFGEPIFFPAGPVENPQSVN